MKHKIVFGLFLLLLFLPTPLFAEGYQDTNRFTYGFRRILMAPFRIPYSTLRGTFYGPPVTGTLGGAVSGTFQTVNDLLGGAFDMAASAAPYAKYAIFFI